MVARDQRHGSIAMLILMVAPSRVSSGSWAREPANVNMLQETPPIMLTVMRRTGLRDQLGVGLH